MKRHAPAVLRNRDAILAILREELPAEGTVLEVASGTGEHVLYFAPAFPNLVWQPSDPDREAIASVAAWLSEYQEIENVKEPLQLDAAADEWPIDQADALLCINMVHISKQSATIGLFSSANRILLTGAPVILYGPYLEDDIETAPSNMQFDANLKARDPRWGLRDLAWVDALAQANNFQRTRREPMPANNLILVYRKPT